MSVDITGLSVRFGDHAALDDINLDIASGERFAVMGPSGAGKSTLLRVIAGLENPDTGTIVVEGRDVTSVPTHQRPIGLMFQDYALFPHMTVLENVAYGPKVTGTARDAALERARELLELVGLLPMASRMPSSLSGGEQQRVALARTLAPRPSLVLFDEPLGSLDLSLKRELIIDMRSIMERVGATSIYVTHDRAEAEAYADRIAVFRSGSIKRIGTPADIWNDPRTPFIARFIGRTNVIQGQAIGLGRTTVVVPMDSITMTESGRLSGEVASCLFHEGSYHLVVMLRGQAITIASPEAAVEGTAVRFDVDTDQVVELSVDEI